MLISAKLAPCFAYTEIERFWRDADELGFHSIWNYDHFYGLTDPAMDTLEGWTTLAAMGTVVKRARIGCMVTGVTYRNPALLANMAVTVDHISGGRLNFGLGAAWHEPEHAAYGIPYPPPGVRIDMLGEALQVIKGLWTNETTSFSGEHFRLTDAMCNPKPVQRPHPPVTVGGNGERKTLRVVAEHADEWNGMGDPDEWARLNRVLDDHCAAVGRDPSAIRRSVQLFIHPAVEGQPEEVIGRIPAYEERGCDHVVLSFYQPPSRELLERVAPR
ncbi:MAG TPA: LLM class F420-dependent oxidoreductase [Actinomycetota bacterium]